MKVVTAALIIIGDEILSGRTKDENLNFLACSLAEMGINLREVRVVPDIEPEIIDAVDAVRKKFDYIFTSGGIGPTHDDITVPSIAKIFGREPEEFKIENIFLLAGIPKIFRAMFEAIKKDLVGGKKVESREIKIDLSESVIAQNFSDLQKNYPNVAMGSYPFDGGTSLVFRSTDYEALELAKSEMETILKKWKKDSQN